MDKGKIKELVWQAVFGLANEKKQAYIKLWQLGQDYNIRPASINDFYLARGQGKLPLDFTVPAINIRGMSFDMAGAVFKTAVQEEVGALIFEIARSEIGYTDQSPAEFVAVIIGSALYYGFSGPLFIQGDHFQVKESGQVGIAKDGDLEKLKILTKEAIEAGFYNIDLDMSTMVDYAKSSIGKQQESNYRLSAELTNFIRDCQPKGVTISLGGEIGHIGGKNSTEEELRAFMDSFNNLLEPGVTGLSKISIQTGTHHGGVPLPDGSLAEVDVDFDTLKRLAATARNYKMGGTVQHGASTLPDKYFSQFPKSEAIEVHLATGFQNIVMDHPLFPKDLLKKMYKWVDETLQEEKKDMTDEQFHYKLRKKAWGQFKRDFWNIPENIKTVIGKDLEKRFAFLFRELNVENSKELINRFVNAPAINK